MLPKHVWSESAAQRRNVKMRNATIQALALPVIQNVSTTAQLVVGAQRQWRIFFSKIRNRKNEINIIEQARKDSLDNFLLIADTYKS